ncbi:MAG: hypothetical protein K6E92_11050 [Lachnospiraceae bacterium]|nr:hypothetical protein [Lachnospiraceae bacterium]
MPKTKREQQIEEIFGDARRVYNEANVYTDENSPFYGDKYQNRSRIPSTGLYTLSRAAGVSVAIFAMANQGKYTLEDLMDKNKFREEKAQMYDEVVRRMQKTTPENQKWIAEQIYKGRNATEKLLDDAAKGMDFSDPGLMQDPKFCQMLQFAFHQFDAWQEMAHCADEIVELAHADMPEITTYEQYKVWWTSKESPLTLINGSMSLQERETNYAMESDEPASHVGNVLLHQSQIQNIIREMAQTQKSDPDKPLSQYFNEEKNMSFTANLMFAPPFVKDKLLLLDAEPDLTAAVVKGIVDRTLTPDVSVTFDTVKGTVEVTGVPEPDEIRKAAMKEEEKAFASTAVDPPKKHEPGSLHEKYGVQDVAMAQELGASFLYGMLGDILKPEEQLEILKKITILYNLGSESNEVIEKIYGEEFCHLNTRMANEEDGLYSVEENIRTSIQKGFHTSYQAPAFDKPLKVFSEGLDELLQAAEKKARVGGFQTDAERNYFFMVKGMLEDAQAGQFAEKYKGDPAYEYMYSVFAKIRNSSVVPQIDPETGEFGVNLKNLLDDRKNIGGLQELGLVETMAQAKLAADLQDAYLKGGNVSREELIEANKRLVERSRHSTEVTVENFDRLKEEGLFDNDYDEFSATGARGFGYNTTVAAAKVKLLEAGYPAGDLPAAGYYVRTLRAVVSDRTKLDSQIETEQKKLERAQGLNPEQIAAKQEEIRKLTEQRDELKTAEERMEAEWADATKDHSMTEIARRRNLQNLANAVRALPDSIRKKEEMAGFAERLLEQRKNTKLPVSERALMARGTAGLLSCLEEVDPKLMRSSEQFRRMKEELKALAEMENTLNLSDPESVKAYRVQAQVTAEATRDYLRFKMRQMDGPVRGHKRSDLEARRVAVADAILSSLNEQTVTMNNGKLPLLRNKVRMGIVPENSNRILSDYNRDNLPNNYSSYILLHTGKGAICGTKEELLDDLSKVLSAQLLGKNKPEAEVDLNTIHACAAQVSQSFHLELAEENELRKALQDPDHVREFVDAQVEKVYGIDRKDLTHSLSDYVKGMRTLYETMPEPQPGDPAYQKLFDTVKKSAHLPVSADGLDHAKLLHEIAQNNFEIMEIGKTCLRGKEHTLGTGGPGDAVLDCVATLTAGPTAIPGGDMGRILESVNRARAKNHENLVASSSYGPFRSAAEAEPAKLRQVNNVMVMDELKRLKPTVASVKEAVGRTDKEVAYELGQQQKPKEAPAPAARPHL